MLTSKRAILATVYRTRPHDSTITCTHCAGQMSYCGLRVAVLWGVGCRFYPTIYITLALFSMNTRSANNLVGTAGEYYVCAELCRRGFLALLTPKNNPLFDVVVTDQDGSRSVSIQVKTRSVHNTQGWKLGTDISKGYAPPSLFVVLVNLNASGLPDFYVYEYPLLSARVAQVYHAYISKPKRDGSPKKEVGFRWFDEVSFNDDDRSRKNNWQPIINALAPA